MIKVAHCENHSTFTLYCFNCRTLKAEQDKAWAEVDEDRAREISLEEHSNYVDSDD